MVQAYALYTVSNARRDYTWDDAPGGYTASQAGAELMAVSDVVVAARSNTGLNLAASSCNMIHASIAKTLRVCGYMMRGAPCSKHYIGSPRHPPQS